MSAEPTRHKDTPKKRGQSTVGQACVSWMQGLRSAENSAPSQERASVAVKRRKTASHSEPSTDEILANLFRAIEGTDLAKSLGTAAPAATPPFQPPRFAEPPDTRESLTSRVMPPPSAANLQRPPSAAPRKTAVAEPTPMLLVQSPIPHAAFAPPMPRPGALSRHIAPPETPRTFDSLPLSPARVVPPPPPAPRKAAETGHPLTLLIQTAPSPASTWLMPPAPKPAESLHGPMAARALEPKPIARAEIALFSAAPRPLASINGGFAEVPVFAPINDEMNPLAAKAALTLKSMRRAGMQLSIGLKNWIVTDAASATRRLGRAIIQLSIGLWSRAVSGAAWATARIAHAGVQLSTALGHWAVTDAAPAAKRLGRAIIQLSLWLTNCAATSAAWATKRITHAGAQLSAALKKRFHTEPALARQRMAQAKTQLSTGFQGWCGPRRSPRLLKPPVIAWCWAADTPQSLNIANISSTGLYLLTEVRWPLGGTVPMTLQRTDRPKDTPESWIVADFRVTRWCRDGVAGALIPPSPYSVACGTENCADQRSLKRFVKQLARPVH